MVICGSSRRSFEKPLSRKPVPGAGLEIQRGAVVKDQGSPGQAPQCAAHAAEICCRHESFAKHGAAAA